MFEDLEEENADVTADSSDRAIAWAIHSRGEVGSITAEEGWAVLHERYPDDARFLLLSTYAELNEAQKLEAPVKAQAAVLTPAYFLKKAERAVERGSSKDGALEPHLRELVVFGAAVLAGAKGDEAKAVADLRNKLGIEGDSKRDERDRAGLKLRRFEREVIKEIEERTQEGKPLGVARAAAPAKNIQSDWATATSDANKPRRKYAADIRFEPGELVEHSKFGVGLVTGIEPGKAVILFESGVRKLVAGA